jgi:Domain of unknown function (DUF4440)
MFCLSSAKFKSLFVFMSLLAMISTSIASELTEKKEFEARYLAFHKAVVTRNRASLEAMMDPTFVSIELTDKTKNRAQVIDEIVAMPIDPNRMAETTVLAVVVSKHIADVVQRYHLKFEKKDGSGVKHRITMDATSSDQWKQMDGNWILLKSRTDEIELKKDGVRAVYKKRPSL